MMVFILMKGGCSSEKMGDGLFGRGFLRRVALSRPADCAQYGGDRLSVFLSLLFHLDTGSEFAARQLDDLSRVCPSRSGETGYCHYLFCGQTSSKVCKAGSIVEPCVDVWRLIVLVYTDNILDQHTVG